MSTEVITKTNGEIISDSLDRIATAISADFEPTLTAGLSSALNQCADGLSKISCELLGNSESLEFVGEQLGEVASAIQFGFASLSDAIRSLKN